MRNIFIFFSLTFFCADAITQNVDSTWNQYVNSEYNFMFNYPSGWERSLGTGAQTVYIEKERENGKNSTNPILWLSSTFYVDVQSLHKGNLKKIGNDHENTITHNVVWTNGKILSRKNIRFRNFKAIELVGIADILTLTAKWRIIILQTDQYYFELCATTQLEKFDELYQTINNIFDSFEFIEN